MGEEDEKRGVNRQRGQRRDESDQSRPGPDGAQPVRDEKGQALAADKVGVPDDKIGWFNFPTVPGGKGEAPDEASEPGRSPGKMVSTTASRKAFVIKGSVQGRRRA